MEEESFIDVMGHAPVYSSGIPGVSVTNPAEFKEWHGRVRRAHEREVDGGVDAMTDADLAEHGLVRKNKEHIISHVTVEVTPHIDWSRMADELDEFVEIVRGIAGGAEEPMD